MYSFNIRGGMKLEVATKYFIWKPDIYIYIYIMLLVYCLYGFWAVKWLIWRDAISFNPQELLGMDLKDTSFTGPDLD
jgi:hypothetical protein